MRESAKQLLLDHLRPGIVLGLVGAGALCDEVRVLAEAAGAARVLLCDPAAATEEADDMSDDFFALWGNGMGGCTLTGEGLEPFLPLGSLAAAGLLVVTAPPETPLPPALQGLVTTAFLAQCPPTTALLCLGHPDVLSVEAFRDPRVIHPI